MAHIRPPKGKKKLGVDQFGSKDKDVRFNPGGKATDRSGQKMTKKFPSPMGKDPDKRFNP